MLKQIDKIAIEYNKTKDPKYKNLWYNKVKEWADGPHSIERWNVSVSSVNKADDGTYVFIGKSKLYGPVRNTKSKTNNVRR